MANIIIYSDNGHSELEKVINPDEEYSVRVMNIADLKDAATFNPSLMVFDCNEAKIKEAAMVTKLCSPALVVANSIIDGLVMRGDVYDYVYKPVNEKELKLRVKNLLKFKDLRDNIAKVSTTDELTGLHNRKYLHERLDAEISRSKRYGNKVSCLLLDIDFFKVVNDMYGYDWGDVLLKRIADMLRNIVRKEDILTRYGDEEFIVILPNTAEENAFLFAERFRRDIEKNGIYSCR